MNKNGSQSSSKAHADGDKIKSQGQQKASPKTCSGSIKRDWRRFYQGSTRTRVFCSFSNFLPIGSSLGVRQGLREIIIALGQKSLTSRTVKFLNKFKLQLRTRNLKYILKIKIIRSGCLCISSNCYIPQLSILLLHYFTTSLIELLFVTTFRCFLLIGWVAVFYDVKF